MSFFSLIGLNRKWIFWSLNVWLDMNGPMMLVLVKNFQWHLNASRNVAVYVQPENVTAIIANPGLCGNSSDGHPFLLVIICSSVGNLEARNAIRQTWVHYQNRTSPYEIRVGFLLGQTFNNSRQNEILAESEMYVGLSDSKIFWKILVEQKDSMLRGIFDSDLRFLVVLRC